MAIKITAPMSKDFTKSSSPRDNFLLFLEEQGLEPHGELIEHGRGKAYSKAEGRERKLKGWYYLFLHQQFPFGACFDWRSGDAPLAQWTMKNGEDHSVTEQDRAKALQAILDARREYEQEIARGHAIAQQEVLKIWQSSKSVTEHPYLQRKNVKSHGLKVSEGPDYAGYLMIPYRDETKQIVTLSYVPPDEGQKWWHKGAKRKGTYAMIGPKLLKTATRINYCEGYATGASWFEFIQEAEPVIVTGDAGGMKEVPKLFQEWYPNVTHVLLADNDESNTGQEACEKAANFIKQHGGKVEIKTPTETGQDFNDVITEFDLLPASEKDLPMETTEVDYTRNKPGGRIMPTTENYKVLLQKEKIDVKYNVISKEMQISIPERKSEYIQDLGEEAQLAELEDRCIKNFVPHQRMVVNLPLIAREYNPVRDWIESVAWDGTSRLQELMDTIDAEDNELKEILMTKWLHGCVAVGCRPEGANLEGVLILQGKQALGKTSWVKRLLPNPEWFLEGATLDPSDKDSVRSVLAHFIVELGELGSTFKRADIDKLKAFITKSKDELRLPYGRAFSRYVRRTAFFGSVNEREFLTDATGNRRFWTVRCKSINFKHKINMQQLWAEMWHKSQEAKEEMWFLTSEEREMLQGSNEMSRTRSAVEELILQHVHFDSIRTEPVQMVKLLKDIGVPNPRVGDFKEASRVLHERGYTARKSNGRKIYDIDYEKADESSFGNKNWND